MTNRFWKTATALFVLGLFYIGAGLQSGSMPALPSVTTPAYAGGVTVATEDAETVFTTSEDGKTIYMWQYYSSKPPKYIGKVEAILSQ